MGVKASFTQQSIDNYFAQVMLIISEEIERTLSSLGEQAVSRVRDRRQEESWFDHTGNLRTSVGYAVAERGRKVIESAFQQVLGGTEGAGKGRQLIDSLVSKYSDTYALIVVAGMDYADRVEALESKDVLASTELWANSMIDSYIAKTTKRIESRIKKLSL